MTVDATEVTKLNNMCPVSNEVGLGTLLSGLAPTELAFLDGVTAGTVTASKAAVVDANKDIGDFRNLDAVNVDAGASGTAGTVDVFPATASKGKLIVSATNNTGDTNVTLTNAAHGQASVYSLRDSGAATGIVPTGTAGSAYTQTYSTADRTHAVPTAAALTDSTTGTADQTVADVGGSFSQATLNNNFADLTDEINKLIADMADTKQLLNAVVDDLQAFGIAG